MFRSFHEFRAFTIPAVVGMVMLGAGCSIQTQNGLVFFGDWSLGVTHSCDKRHACRGGRFQGCGCQNNQCMGGCSEDHGIVQNSTDGNTLVEEPMPARGGPQQAPPPAVHNRLHPVPTKPVFGNPNVNRDRTIEALPHEYSSTPRLRSIPRPQVDDEELKEEKQRAKDADRKELEWIPYRTFP